ncbi:MAG: gamma-glutamyl-gamma-aminobutyrate hydrolase family protein [Clostridiales bacterium]|jgi:putative glutamine amidotransferase|nr:gamma-glutamyl-gamma-aminobutyrate hydrolase family protein [Clostridiales bacterium]
MKIKKKAVIGVTPSIADGKYSLNEDYVKAFMNADAAVVILTLGDAGETLRLVDGVLLSGGGDIDSKYFGEPLHPLARVVDARRDAFEIELCRRAFAARKPMLCICRGIQVLNVALGGSVSQHIEGHFFEDLRREKVHNVKIAENTLLRRILGVSETGVNSVHHQAAGTVAKALEVSARADDGTIEALEARNGFTLGVQWHPEAIFDKFEEQAAIFKAFARAVAEEPL